MTLQEVTKEDFHNKILTLDVTVTPTGNFPYTTDFKLRNGTLKGRIVDSYQNGKHYPIIRKYFIVA